MSSKEEDKLFKYATKEDGFALINLINKQNLNIKENNFKSENLTFNPTELIELDPKIYKSDMIMELDNIIIITEFQSTIVKEFDEKRYRLYTAIVDYAKKNKKPILLIVFSTAEKTKIKKYNLNKDCVFTIPIISLKDFNGDEIINNIEYKIRNNIKITRQELIHLSLTPFMSSKNPLEKQIEKTVQTLDKIKNSTTSTKNFAFGIEFLIVDKFIKETSKRKRLRNILSDNMRLMEEYGQERYEEGLEKGYNEGAKNEKRKIAKTLLTKHMPLEEIATLTKLSINELNQLKK
ncbi:hypothetical protein [uncultured Methanobrevibacter sp.]|uniref:hypothetical protein n=1 Tax=uncultured Methanobrevibacter sp. TaxID=253161 RepID=UPI0026307AA6|nr:hypothetical protein [uncultured Methanobrevibacter sp.]